MTHIISKLHCRGTTLYYGYLQYARNLYSISTWSTTWTPNVREDMQIINNKLWVINPVISNNIKYRGLFQLVFLGIRLRISREMNKRLPLGNDGQVREILLSSKPVQHQEFKYLWLVVQNTVDNEADVLKIISTLLKPMAVSGRQIVTFQSFYSAWYLTRDHIQPNHLLLRSAWILTLPSLPSNANRRTGLIRSSTHLITWLKYPH